MWKLIFTLILKFSIIDYIHCQSCIPSVTTVLGTYAPVGEICSGDLIFEEEFDILDTQKWFHEITIGGGGVNITFRNGEFQYYLNDRRNSFVNDGKLVLRPTLTIDTLGEQVMFNGLFEVPDCNQEGWGGCEHNASADYPLNPIMSGKVTTVESFAFKYGKVEISAKLPAGDWLWPALWLLPNQWVYGGWPMSGEIDLMESRGNRYLYNNEMRNIGWEEIGATLHFGNEFKNGYAYTTFSKNSPYGQAWSKDFHRYQLEWTPDFIRWTVDDKFVNIVRPGLGGFFELGEIPDPNPWIEATKMAPFDQEFHILINLAIGATNGYFPETYNYGGKAWKNNSPTPKKDFWNARNQWLPTWNLEDDDSYEASFVIDYVKVWAL